MGATNIEWADFTFNPWWGCAKVSPGCKHCYADTFARRVGHGKRLPTIWGEKADRRFFSDAHWQQPLKWAADADASGRRARVFCASMSDVFEDRPELVEPRRRLATVIRMTPGLDWLLLTKRPENMVRLTETFWRGAWPSNVWAGTTAEDQERANERIRWLLNVPARVRFLSCEPMLGPINIRNYDELYTFPELPGIHWVIIGSESGPGARSMNVEWARSLRAQCRNAGIACFVKQIATPNDRKGGDWSHWPEDMRVRQFPEVAA